VIEFGVTKLKIKHIIVCGHYNCGGVQSALSGNEKGIIGDWLKPIEKIRDTHSAELEKLEQNTQKWARLCELNVIEQVRTLSQLGLLQRVEK